MYLEKDIVKSIGCIYKRGLLALSSNIDGQCEKPQKVGWQPIQIPTLFVYNFTPTRGRQRQYYGSMIQEHDYLRKRKTVTIILPVFNEQKSFDLIKNRMRQVLEDNADYDWEFLLVNDGSSDDSLNCMIRLRNEDAEHWSYLNLSRNFGKEAAMLAGLDYAKGDAVIIMDSDMQHPISAIPEMLKWWEEGYNDVYAVRKSSGESFFKRKTSQLYYKILQRTTRVPIQKDTGDFRLLDRRCVDVLRKLRETERNTKGLYCWIGYKKIGIQYEQLNREEGETKWNVPQLINLAISGITSYTIAPLRVSTFIGFVVSVAALMYMLYVLVKTIMHGNPVSGFPTIVILILFLGGIQLISIGIIGEYLGRVFNESKGRPVYVADTYNGSPI